MSPLLQELQRRRRPPQLVNAGRWTAGKVLRAISFDFERERGKIYDAKLPHVCSFSIAVAFSNFSTCRVLPAGGATLGASLSAFQSNDETDALLLSHARHTPGAQGLGLGRRHRCRQALGSKEGATQLHCATLHINMFLR